MFGPPQALSGLSSFCLAAVSLCAGNAIAGDWPQILGPGRDGVAVGEKLVTWGPDGPLNRWTQEVGEGFAGVAVRGKVLILFHRDDEQEIVEARDKDTGKKIWSSPFPCRYQSGMSSDAGPRCVPVTTDTRVIIYGVTGVLRCLDLKTGEEVWSRDTWNDFEAPEGYFGAGSTPVIFGDKVIVNVGSRKNAGVVAFLMKDGATAWQNVVDTASYSSPVIARIDGGPQVIVVTRLKTVCLNPVDGAIRSSFPFGARGPTVNGATPVVMDDHIFVSASYRVGSVWAKLSAKANSITDTGESLLATQYATPVKHGDLLFAVDGRQDSGSASLKCVDPANQKILWDEPGFDYGSLIRVNDEMLFLTCGGELIRFAADRSGYRETARHTVLAPTPRGYRLPAISGGRLFVRDDDNLKCLIVGETK